MSYGGRYPKGGIPTATATDNTVLPVGANGTGLVADSTTATGLKYQALPSDYQEGTFTPTFLGSTTNPASTYTVQVGRYTKIGRQVTVQINIQCSAQTGGSGSLQIGGLPFTSSNVAGTYALGVLNPGAFAVSDTLTSCGDVFVLIGPNAALCSPTFYSESAKINGSFPLTGAKNILATITYTV